MDSHSHGETCCKSHGFSSRFQRQHQLLREGIQMASCRAPSAQRRLATADSDAQKELVVAKGWKNHAE
jgi:hypothetical protein